MSDDRGGRPDMFAGDYPTPQELEAAGKDAGEAGFRQRMDRVEGLLEELVGSIAKRSDVERVDVERRCEFAELRGKISELSCDVLRMGEARADGATRQDVEEVARSQRDEFAWLRESHAWLRGAATVAAPERAPRSGVVALCVLWAMGAFAAFSVGAIALGLVSVSVSWKGGGLEETASATLWAPPLLDGTPEAIVPARRPPSVAVAPEESVEVMPAEIGARRAGSGGPGGGGQ